MRVGPSQEEIRRSNLGALLRSVHLHGAMSRADLTTSLGLNRSTIGALTADLAGAGLVSEGVPREQRGRAGRPSLVVRPESEKVYVYAFAVEVDRIVAARVGLGGVLLDRFEAARPRGEHDAATVVAPIADFVRKMQLASPAGARLIGSGAAVSAMVRRDDGYVRLGPQLGWADQPLGEALGVLVGDGRPVAVRNNADLAALAEHTRGAAAGCDNLVYLYGDAGIGGGIIAAGRPVTGHGGYGGEVGHMVVNPNGKPCSCGSHGCWETEIGEHALLAAAGRNATAGREGILAVVDAASRGDNTAQAAMRQVGDWLGFGVANLVNIFNPEMVIFGGTLREVYLASAAQVRSRLNRNGLPACREHVRLRTPQLGQDAALIGAAELAFEPLFADPLFA
ncbi:ROK family protein [Dactylosporangium matsuzakiense]|uniref:Sugar kinase n=1 Tax=Dactylosporangium matsuzakiense TaxID=53360 RepID=A0A9W6KTG6_9ACTN|nr:ROK family protein [Dactylosporangium matsuzakiense]UWZ48971.1 ROK family protein [Dactylosporangium matsuzakiense]GLL07787.1 sugar kinase [Dactylosporangium matsuzakiense]